MKSFKFLSLLVIYYLATEEGMAASEENPCQLDEFYCDGGLCISDIYYCDGHYDCTDKTDEKFCPEIRKSHHTCKTSEFMCVEGTCLPDRLVCDGVDDCLQGEDETGEHCKVQSIDNTTTTSKQSHECPVPNYRCNDKGRTCIAQRFVCDGEADCEDGSDEVNCGQLAHHTECLASQGKFACKKSTAYDHDVRCLDAAHVCDGKPQCPHGEDEAGDLCGSHACANHSCQQLCLETQKGPSCYCQNGYRLAADERTCEDVDECKIFGTCDQICHNIKGGYTCSCLDNYSLVNGSRCQFNGDAEILLTLESTDKVSEIRSFNLHTRELLPLVSGLNTPVGVGYDLNNNRLFWTDAAPGRPVIEMARIQKNRSAATVEIFMETGLEHPEDLAMDQATGLVYFSDSGKARISACSIVTSICATIYENLSQPRGIAIHSSSRLLFVSEWASVEQNSHGQIIVMNMDGSAARPIVTKDIAWANSIAVDETIDRVFWSDAQRDTVESATVEGKDRRVIVQDISHPFGVAVFEDRVFWSDWHEYRLYSANKFTGRDIRMLVSSPHRINGIAVYHTVPTSVHNSCFESRCSHLCVPTGTEGQISHRETYSCKCPADMHLASDRLTCRRNVFTDPVNRLIVAAGNNLYSLKPQALGRLVLETVGFETSLVTGLSNFVARDVLVATTNTGHVFNVNAHWKTSHLISVEGPLVSLSHDSLQSNLFWIDSARKTIIIMSEHSKHMRVLVHCQDPKALVYVHSKNVLAFIDGSNLMETSLDGQLTSLLASNVSPTALLLTYSEEAKSYLIAGQEGIAVVTPGLNGLAETLVEASLQPVSVTVQGDYLYWTQKQSNILYWTNIKRHSSDQSVYSMALNITAQYNIFLSATVDLSAYPQAVCSLESCSDICIRSHDKMALCMCGEGRTIVQDEHWNTCKDDSTGISRVLPDLANLPAKSKTSSIIVIVLCVGIGIVSMLLLVVFCCRGKAQRSKTAEFINRSFGLSPPTKPVQNQEMCGVEVINRGLTTEIENPGFTSINLYAKPNTPRCPPPPPNTPSSLAKKDMPAAGDKEGLLQGVVRSIRSFRDPKMSSMDWSESSIGYENLSSARGSSTPRGSKSPLDTIREGDSAYTDMSTSLSYDEDVTSIGSSDRNHLIA